MPSPSRWLRQWSVLRAYPDYLRLFAGDAISLFGSSVSAVALPLTAVLVLDASAIQMGVLGAAGFLPHLILGLPAGVWVDRMPYRRVLVLADLGRALLFGSIPVLALADALAMWHLYAVALLAGAGTLFGALTSTSFVPSLVERRHLLQANSLQTQSHSVMGVSGSAIGGALVQVLTAPIAIAVDAISFLVAAICKGSIRTPGPRVAAPTRRPLWVDVKDGLRAVLADPVLKPMILSATIGALAGQMQAVIGVLYLSRQLGLTPGVIGVALAVAGGAAVLSSVIAGPITQRIGHGPAYITGVLLASSSGFVLAAAAGPFLLVLPILVLAQLLQGAGPPMYSINQLTIRQALAGPDVLARVNATWRFLVFGAQPVGAFLGGLIADGVGLRATLVLSSLGMLLGVAIAVASPLRTLRTLPAT